MTRLFLLSCLFSGQPPETDGPGEPLSSIRRLTDTTRAGAGQDRRSDPLQSIRSLAAAVRRRNAQRQPAANEHLEERPAPMTEVQALADRSAPVVAGPVVSIRNESLVQFGRGLRPFGFGPPIRRFSNTPPLLADPLFFGPIGYEYVASETTVYLPPGTPAGPGYLDYLTRDLSSGPLLVTDPRPGGRVDDGVARPTRDGVNDVDPRSVERLVAASRRPSLDELAQAVRLQAAGDRNFRSGHFGNAVLRYQESLAIDRTRDEARFRLGAALIADAQYPSAMRVLRTALRERPDWPFNDNSVRDLFASDAALHAVLDSVERAADEAELSTELRFLAAYLLYFGGRRDEAIRRFRDPPLRGFVDSAAFLDAIDNRERQTR